jgi:proteasome assembly chaperone (PAC2) family protein
MTAKTQLIAFIIAFFLSTPVLADALPGAGTVYVDKAVADRAIEHVKGLQTLKYYCDYWGEPGREKSIAVTSIISKNINYEGLWVVEINGEERDLTCIYALDDYGWHNLGVILGIISMTDDPNFPEFLNKGLR